MLSNIGSPALWRRLIEEYNLIGSYCAKCERHFFPARTICPFCRREGKMEKYQFCGTGKVITWTIVRTAPPGFERQTPYIMAIIRLTEGATIESEIKNCKEEAIYYEMPVEAVFRRIGEPDPSGVIRYGAKFVPRQEAKQ